MRILTPSISLCPRFRFVPPGGCAVPARRACASRCRRRTSRRKWARIRALGVNTDAVGLRLVVRACSVTSEGTPVAARRAPRRSAWPAALGVARCLETGEPVALRTDGPARAHATDHVSPRLNNASRSPVPWRCRAASICRPTTVSYVSRLTAWKTPIGVGKCGGPI